MKIHSLTADVISKIAAGEVIERPVFAVKELVENALDAKATIITIELENSGLQKIVVTDNGEGMSREDMQLCFLRHTTSKLSSIDDLMSITSLGFRGEALASIAAMSLLTIKSKTSQDVAGTEVVLEAGNLKKISPVGISPGTSITVENLFSNVPARHKFLKSKTTEFRYILQSLTKHAIAFPAVGFQVIHNGKKIFQLPKNQTFDERIRELLGATTYEFLIPVSYTQNGTEVLGYIAKPQLSTESATKQYLYVNSRSVNNRIISMVVKEAYGTLLEPHALPIYVLFLNIPHSYVDVNVHPRKEEIASHGEETIKQAINKAVTQSLRNHNITFHDARWNRSDSDNDTSKNWSVRDGSTDTYAADLLREGHKPTIETVPYIEQVYQLHNLYLVVQTKDGVVLIDQHAAHERILYEQFLESFEIQKQNISQHILPHTVLFDVSLHDVSIIQEHETVFKKLGFDIDLLGRNTVRVTAVPSLFKDRNIIELLTEFINDISQNESIKSIDVRSERMISYLACRSAVKAGDVLNQDEMKDLLNQLRKTKNPYTCPHGRPIQHIISLLELQRLFKRK